MNIKEIARLITEDEEAIDGSRHGPSTFILRPLNEAAKTTNSIRKTQERIDQFSAMIPPDNPGLYGGLIKGWKERIIRLQTKTPQREITVDAWAYANSSLIVAGVQPIVEYTKNIRSTNPVHAPGFRDAVKVPETWEIYRRNSILFQIFKKWEIAVELEKQQQLTQTARASSAQVSDMDVFDMDVYGETAKGHSLPYMENVEFADYIKNELPEHWDLIENRHNNDNMPLYKATQYYKHIFWIGRDNVVNITGRP